jgi:hypothetical protein
MTNALRPVRTSGSKATLAVLALAAFAPLVGVACGGGGEAAPAPATPAGGAAASAPAGAASAGAPKKAEPAGPKLPDKPESDKVTWKRDPSFASCHNDVKTGADLVAGVTAMAKGCAGQMKMHQVGTTVQGSRGNLDPANVIPLHAEASHCYRVYGLSEDALKDLDIAIMDSAGKECAEDGSDSPDAVVLEDGAVCFTSADDVKVNVASGAGAGKYAVQIWSD